jgi:hypothetical protein
MDKKFKHLIEVLCIPVCWLQIIEELFFLGTNYWRAKKKPLEKKRSHEVAHLKDVLK